MLESVTADSVRKYPYLSAHKEIWDLYWKTFFLNSLFTSDSGIGLLLPLVAVGEKSLTAGLTNCQVPAGVVVVFWLTCPPHIKCSM